MKEKLEEVFAICKRGSDKNTTGQKCDSNTAKKLNSEGSHVVIFRCTKCSFQWNVPIGGSFSL
jgi:hypothetical protein